MESIPQVTQKHTPGPWVFDWELSRHEVRACDGQMKIADVRGWGYLTGTGALNLPVDEATAIHEANGRLIATSPDLLDAAQDAASELLEAFPYLNPKECKAVIDKLFAAINKATGGNFDPWQEDEEAQP